jgi:methionyl-tRNA formyltransferase
MRVVFFGNHDVGIQSLKSLLASTEVVAVVAHPLDPEEGIRYASVYDFAVSQRINAIRGKAKDSEIFEFLKAVDPDLLWITDYRYILPKQLISIARHGAVNMHPSLLPKYRGRAPINWAILNGENEIGLTAHYVDEGVDTGDIIAQVPIPLSIDEDVGDALRKLLPLYRSVTREVIEFFKKGNVPRFRQELADSPIFPARKPGDGRIDWSKSAVEIRNLVRAVAHPYPGAFTETAKGRVFIWKASISRSSEEKKSDPGKVIALIDNNGFSIQCGEGILHVEKWTSDFDISNTFILGNQL